MAVSAIARFERLFRAAAGLDVDKDDLRRYGEFINRKTHDLLVVGEAAAGQNGRDVVEYWDLPITKGFEQSIHEFREIDAELQLQPILDEFAARDPNITLSVEAESRLTEIAGGLSVALARTLKIIDPTTPNPASQHWERAFRVFDLLL